MEKIRIRDKHPGSATLPTPTVHVQVRYLTNGEDDLPVGTEEPAEAVPVPG